MTLESILENLDSMAANYCLQEPMSVHTTYKLGGPAAIFISPREAEELQEILRLLFLERSPYFILGAGSNLLVADRGYRGAILYFMEYFTALSILEKSSEKVVIEVGAGVKNRALLQFCQEHGISGAEFLTGIPGTAGGAVAMNAGTQLGRMEDILVEVQVLSGNRYAPAWQPSNYFKFDYRRTTLSPGSAIANIRLRLRPEDPNHIAEIIDAQQQIRDSKYPDQPSAGSVFLNPPGKYAGRLIQEAGLKGHRIGGAQVSPQHGNFLVNLQDDTRAEDIKALMELVRKEVKAKFNVELQPEVGLLGFTEGFE